MDGTGFAVSSVRTAGHTRVVVAGELDLGTVRQVEAELGRVETSGTALIVLDLSRVTFFDAAGLQAILDADERALEAARGFAVRTGRVVLRRVLELLGHGHLLSRESSDDRAPRTQADPVDPEPSMTSWLNEAVEQSDAGFADGWATELVVCQCGDSRCTEAICLTLAEYEAEQRLTLATYVPSRDDYNWSPKSPSARTTPECEKAEVTR